MPKCKGCGMEIQWETTDSGASAPMQKIRAAFYKGDGGELVAIKTENAQLLVNHFETCPKASSFSGKNRGA